MGSENNVLVGDEPDRWMDSIVGLDNWQEIVGDSGQLVRTQVGQEAFPRVPVSDAQEPPFPTYPSDGLSVSQFGTGVSIGQAVKRIAEEAAESRQPVPELSVTPLEHVEDGEDDSIDIMVGQRVGDQALFPLTQNLFNQFQANSADGKIVRLDNEGTYADFRAKGLMRSLAPHSPEAVLGDEPAGGSIYRPIHLQLPPYADGCVDCWQQDDMICCSLRLPGEDGEARIATAATPVAVHVDEVMGYVARAGISPVDILGALPSVVAMLGGGSLVPKIASAAPSLLERPEAKSGGVFVGRMKGGTKPTQAALMQLLQMAQSGDSQAIAEWGAFVELSRTPGGAGLKSALEQAQSKLLAAQRVA